MPMTGHFTPKMLPLTQVPPRLLSGYHYPWHSPRFPVNVPEYRRRPGSKKEMRRDPAHSRPFGAYVCSETAFEFKDDRSLENATWRVRKNFRLG